MAKVLVVDDDPAVQLMVRLVLERAGHAVAAGGGNKRLAECEHSGFDLLLLDIFMPGMDGLQTMRMVRAKRPLLPIIMICGRPVTEDLQLEPDFLSMATKLGATYSLPKPFKPEALLPMVAQCLKSETQTLPAPDRNVASSR